MEPSKARRAFYFLISQVRISRLRTSVHTPGNTWNPVGTLDCGITEKFPLSIWSFISFSIAALNSFWSLAFMASCSHKMSGCTALYASMGFRISSGSWFIAGKLRSSPSTFFCLLAVETSSNIIRLMSLGTGLTSRPDSVVIGITLGSCDLSNATGCPSTTMAREGVGLDLLVLVAWVLVTSCV